MRTHRSIRLLSARVPSLIGPGQRAQALQSAWNARWMATLAAIAVVVLVPYFSAGDPPGVDSPTFLHFGWVFEQSLLGASDSFLNDPWWYGGLPYLQAYSPVGYGLVGLFSVITPLDLAVSYKLVMLLGFTGTALSTYWLGRTLNLDSVFAFTAGTLVLLSYPVIAGVGIFGWFPTLVSMPIALAAYIYVEKWTVSRSTQHVVIAGALLGLSLIAHHMTAIAIGMAITVRLGMFAADNSSQWRASLRAYLFIGVAAAAVSVWWVVPFLVNTLSVGFERELAGNWQFPISTFVANLFNRSLISVETYPSYIGIAQGVLGTVGAIYAIAYKSRLRGLAVAAVILIWFSMGASANPLVRVYPFSGFDVSRFAFYVAPLLALLSASVLQSALKIKVNIPARVLPAALVFGVLILPVIDTFQSRGVLEPVDEPVYVTETIGWMEQNISPGTKVLVVGFRNWDGYWIPARAGLPIMDGWYDEGAENWRPVRDYRLMGWLRDVDPDRLHEIMAGQGVEFMVVTEWDTTESPDLFLVGASERPDLFSVEAVLNQSTVFKLR